MYNNPTTEGMVEIPMWRHALISFPHPLLKEGLTIVDTPGLNALGNEPELTINMLPNAQAVPARLLPNGTDAVPLRRSKVSPLRFVQYPRNGSGAQFNVSDGGGSPASFFVVLRLPLCGTLKQQVVME